MFIVLLGWGPKSPSYFQLSGKRVNFSMKEEYITIENGRIEENGIPVFTDLNLRIYKKQMIGFIF